MAGEERHGAQPQLVDAALKLSRRSFGLMNRQVNTAAEARRVVLFDFGDAIVERSGHLGAHHLDLIRQNTNADAGFVHALDV